LAADGRGMWSRWAAGGTLARRTSGSPPYPELPVEAGLAEPPSFCAPASTAARDERPFCTGWQKLVRGEPCRLSHRAVPRCRTWPIRGLLLFPVLISWGAAAGEHAGRVSGTRARPVLRTAWEAAPCLSRVSAVADLGSAAAPRPPSLRREEAAPSPRPLASGRHLRRTTTPSRAAVPLFSP